MVMMSDVLTESNVFTVASRTGYKAVQFGMLGLVDEAYSILSFLAEQSAKGSDRALDLPSGPLTNEISDIIQFMYEITTQSPPEGAEKYNEGQLAGLEQKLVRYIPDIPDGVNNGNEDDFETLKTSIGKLYSKQNDATTGWAVRFPDLP